MCTETHADNIQNPIFFPVANASSLRLDGAESARTPFPVSLAAEAWPITSLCIPEHLESGANEFTRANLPSSSTTSLQSASCVRTYMTYLQMASLGNPLQYLKNLTPL